MKPLSGTLTILATAIMLLGSTSCATSERSASAITKVKYFGLNPRDRVRTHDRMLKFEQRYYRHGAVDDAQLEKRIGHYYSVFWKTDDRSTDIKLRLDYRHQSTGPKNYSYEVDIDKVRRRNLTKFAVVGEAYETLGPVTAWKVSLIINGEVAGENKSFLWQ